MNQVNQTINQNKITLKDIRTRKKHWSKPFKEIILSNGVKQKEDNPSYRDLVFYTKWEWWQPSYEFLPTPDKFVKIKEDFLNQTWGTLEKQEYYIISNQKNVLTIILQNKGQYNFANQRIVLFYGRNANDPECKKNQEKAGRKGIIEHPTLYWVTDWNYINNENLLVQITAKQCPIWVNYGDMMNSKGCADITGSQLNNEHNEHPDDAGEQNANNCSACDNCYDFCGDLRVKRAVPPGYTTPEVGRWQPGFNLLYTQNSQTALSNLEILDEEGKVSLLFPNSIHLAKYTTISHGEILTSSKPVLLFLVDKDHHKTPFANAKKESFEQELPKCYNDQPHLLNHSSAQFFFQKKLVTMGNLRHLEVRRKNGKLVLCYEIITRSSISGILYQFRSGEIFGRFELKVRGSTQNHTSINGMLDRAVNWMGDGVSKLNLPDEGAVGEGLAVVGGIFKLLKAVAQGWIQKQVGSSISDAVTGNKLEELLGVKATEEQNKDTPQTEQQIKRSKKNAIKQANKLNKAVDNIITPSLFYSNTVEFNYDPWEFANRCVANPFMIRFEHSEILYNNLANNNNKSPIQTIQNRFSAFKQCIKVGPWQGKVNLLFSDSSALIKACELGTFFYDDLDQLFQPWRPSYKTLQSFTHGDIFNTALAQGLEDFEITTRNELVIERLITTDMTVAAYSNVDYIGSPDDNIWQELNRANNYCHVGNFPFPNNCLGCLCGGGSHSNPNYNFESTYNFTSGGRLILKTQGGGEKQCTIPPQGGRVRFWAKGNVGYLDSETTITIQEKKPIFKFDIHQAEKLEEYQAREYEEPIWTDSKTQFGSNIREFDPESLEKLPDFEDAYEQSQFDKPENLKEGNGIVEKEFQKELEKQKELQKQLEMERQLEKDLEKEKERKQRESDFDREKDRLEQEKTRERLTREAKVRERLAERLRERLEREAKTRERLRQREQERTKRDKERE